MNVQDQRDLPHKSARFELYDGGIAFVIRSRISNGAVAAALQFVDVAHAREFMAFREIELNELAADEVFGA